MYQYICMKCRRSTNLASLLTSQRCRSCGGELRKVKVVTSRTTITSHRHDDDDSLFRNTVNTAIDIATSVPDSSGSDFGGGGGGDFGGGGASGDF